MRHIGLGLASLLLSFMFVGTASANVNTLSSDPSYGAGPFLFYCQPYVSTFTSNGHYAPTGGPCTFSIPNTIAGNKSIGIYKGVPGNATLISGDGVFIQSATLVQEESATFDPNTPLDTDFFAVVWSLDQFGGSNGALGQYLATGSPVPETAVLGQNYYLLPWKWQTPPDTGAPTITITTPQDGHTYLSNETLTITATITDPEGSPLRAPAYQLNGTFIDGAQPLALSTLPLGPNELVVYASDIFSNVNSATSNFIVAEAPTDVCPLVNGNQSTGPCANTLCVAPATWNVTTQTCVAPPADTTPPVITITNPLKYGIYERTDSVFLTATIVDASPIVESTYWLNGKKINPAVKLPLDASTPVLSKVMVAAKDSAGNRATTTLPFFVVKNKSNCLVDIVAIFIALTQDKTLPDKPTLQNLIADCSCLNLGHHRWDWDNNNNDHH